MQLGERLKSSRQGAGLSLRALAERVGVSAQAISKYERNEDMPGSGVLLRLSDALGVSIEYLLRPQTVTLTEPVYRRHRSSMTRRAEIHVQAQVQDWLERYTTIECLLGEERSFVMPTFSRQVAHLDQVEDVAIALREAWQLGLDAIPNLTETLEAVGIKVGFVPGNDHFDALSLVANGVTPVIVVKQDAPGDRQRFSMAHELAHLVLDLPETWSEARVEQAANRFAAAFLVAKPTVFNELGWRRHSLDLVELHLLKQKYGLSMQGWVHRAQDLAIISPQTAQKLYRTFRSQGWHITEPGAPYPCESSTRLERLVLRALRDDVIGPERAAELLGKPLTQFMIEVQRPHEEIPLRY
ncbi:MAG: XRE family transcriptional regulator [Desulfosoma sp.]